MRAPAKTEVTANVLGYHLHAHPTHNTPCTSATSINGPVSFASKIAKRAHDGIPESRTASKAHYRNTRAAPPPAESGHPVPHLCVPSSSTPLHPKGKEAIAPPLSHPEDSRQAGHNSCSAGFKRSLPQQSTSCLPPAIRYGHPLPCKAVEQSSRRARPALPRIHVQSRSTNSRGSLTEWLVITSRPNNCSPDLLIRAEATADHPLAPIQPPLTLAKIHVHVCFVSCAAPLMGRLPLRETSPLPAS